MDDEKLETLKNSHHFSEEQQPFHKPEQSNVEQQNESHIKFQRQSKQSQLKANNDATKIFQT